jgi:hypothetical protein
MPVAVAGRRCFMPQGVRSAGLDAMSGVCTVGEFADIHGRGQISKPLTRLERHGLLENVRGDGRQPIGESNAWRLTRCGEAIERASRVHLGDGKSLGNDERKRAGR